MAATAAACQALCLRGLLSDLTGWKEERVLLRVDNRSAIALMKNPVFHGRSKHINTRFHFIRECIEREEITVERIDGNKQKADILTKALPRLKVADTINSICKEVAWAGYYEEQWKTLNNYCNGYWPKRIAWLRRTYFASPWNIIALIAGIILFALTAVQTIFTIKPTSW